MKKMLAVVLIMLSWSVGLAYGQSAKDAYKALKKVEARTETHITFKDYPALLADAKTEINLFLESEEAKTIPQFTDHIKTVWNLYMIAGKIWSLGITENKDEFGMETVNGKYIKALYPNAKDYAYCYLVKETVQSVWMDASKELKQAKQYLK